MIDHCPDAADFSDGDGKGPFEYLDALGEKALIDRLYKRRVGFFYRLELRWYRKASRIDERTLRKTLDSDYLFRKRFAELGTEEDLKREKWAQNLAVWLSKRKILRKLALEDTVRWKSTHLLCGLAYRFTRKKSENHPVG